MNARPTLLIVSYHFAPSPAVGAKRFSFLTREFERAGFDVHVITNDSAESPHGKADASLPLAGRIHRCAAPFELPIAGGGWFVRKLNSLLRRLLAPVGLEYFWARAATRTALEIARDLPPGIVIATSPPYAALFAGARVARRLGWPLILDYRDPWSANDWPKWRRGKFVNALAHGIEQRLVRHSAARVLNTSAMRDAFEKFFPFAASADNFVIPNGFDAMPVRATPPSNAIEIVHAGEIFTGRSLVPVLSALRSVQERQPERALRLTTYGNLPPGEWQRIRDAGLESFVTVQPRIPFDALSLKLQAAHVLLAVVGDHMRYSTPYKVYDYMAAGRPILGLAPAGAALFELLAESGAGICVEPGDSAGIAQALAQLLFTASQGAARNERFHWSNLALQYRAVIEQVAGEARDTRTHTTPAGISA